MNEVPLRTSAVASTEAKRSCPTDDAWARLAEGTTATNDAAEIRGHAAECEGCHLMLVGLDLTSAIDLSTSPWDDPNPEHTAPAARVGRYVIVETLGEGAMGIVYRAHDPELDRQVALKLLKPSASDREGRELTLRLHREARAMAKLSHPNVVTVHDVGTHELSLYVAMELVHGGTLAACLERGELPLVEIVRCFRDVSRGLAAAHDVGIVHRDLKPQNVLVSSDGAVKITDFGLARYATDETAEVRSDPKSDEDLGQAKLDDVDALAATALTRTGQIVGTPAYMAPEQFRGATTDGRTDLFALGVGLHTAVFGVRPFGGATLSELRANVLGNRRTPIDRRTLEELARGQEEGSLRRVHAVASIVRIIDRCLAPEPHLRPSSPREVAEELEHARRDLDAGIAPVAVTATKSRRGPWFGAAALLAMTGVGAGLFARPAPGSHPNGVVSVDSSPMNVSAPSAPPAPSIARVSPLDSSRASVAPAEPGGPARVPSASSSSRGVSRVVPPPKSMEGERPATTESSAEAPATAASSTPSRSRESSVLLRGRL